MNLELEDYEVVSTADGDKVLDIFRNQRFNLVILDVMLPGMDGFTICEHIRLEDQQTPILFLTAKGDSVDKIKGLKIGADDYLAKPFNLEELMLRTKVLVKHSLKGSDDDVELHTYDFGANKIDLPNYAATTYKGEDIKLTKKEAMLLKLLIDRQGEVVSRQQILQYVWGYDVFPSTRTIDNFILAFRKYFEEDPRSPKFFLSIRGVGYKFEG